MSDPGEHKQVPDLNTACNEDKGPAAEGAPLPATLALGIAAIVVWLGTKILGFGTRKTGSPSGMTAAGLSSTTPPVGCAECTGKARSGGEGSRLLKVEPVSHEQIGTFLVACAFLLSLAGGIAFVILYWTGGSNILLGCALSCFCGGLGAAFVLWSHLLILKREIIEPREPLESSAAERQGAAEDFRTGTSQIHRRGLLKWMLACGAGTFATMTISLFRSLGTAPEKSLHSNDWKAGQRLMTLEGKPMRVDALEPGGTALVFPEDSIGSEKAQTVLVRVDESLLQLPSDRTDWAPRGNLAFSRVCTHAGCPVGMYETTTHLLMCPCHQSTFDVLRAAEPTGGPAARALPQLPLYVDPDGVLRAGGGFSDVPGPGFWGMS